MDRRKNVPRPRVETPWWWWVWAVIVLAAVATLGFVAYHFIAKWW